MDFEIGGLCVTGFSVQRRDGDVPSVPDADDCEGMEVVEEEFTSDDVDLPAAAVELQTWIDTHASVSLQLRLLERESIDLQHVPTTQWTPDMRLRDSQIQDEAIRLVGQSQEITQRIEMYPEVLWDILDAVTEHDGLLDQLEVAEQKHMEYLQSVPMKDAGMSTDEDPENEEEQFVEEILAIEEELSQALRKVQQCIEAYHLATGTQQVPQPPQRPPGTRRLTPPTSQTRNRDLAATVPGSTGVRKTSSAGSHRSTGSRR